MTLNDFRQSLPSTEPPRALQNSTPKWFRVSDETLAVI